MAIDEQHVALPKLYGAPAYARPPRPAAEVKRPFDPDDLPIEAVRTDEERELISTLPGDAFVKADGPSPELRPRPLSLRALAGRLRPTGDASHADN